MHGPVSDSLLRTSLFLLNCGSDELMLCTLLFFMTTRYNCECFTKHSYWLTGSICQGHTQLNLPLLATVQEFLLNATWGGLLNHRLT
jgi:hypothetical protein